MANSRVQPQKMQRAAAKGACGFGCAWRGLEITLGIDVALVGAAATLSRGNPIKGRPQSSAPAQHLFPEHLPKTTLTNMHFTTAASLALVAAAASTSVSAQACTDTPVAGDAAFVAEGWSGIKSNPTGNQQWTLAADAAGGDPAKGYVAVHFNPAKCQDLSQYKGVAFEYTGPANGKFQVSWAVRNADCQTKATSKYWGSFLPFGILSSLRVCLDEILNTKYVEDMTIINFNPAPTAAGGEWKISNLTLKCAIGSAAGNTSTPTTSGSPTATGTNKPVPANSGALSGAAASLGSLVAAGAAAVFLA
ncbi:hypothetical protein DFS34DRAFT_114424 [Phlyctochytrium arcticum]|nr:hypothetical protein DFS34DRAFT_114424 [Phlyctochytrium arcticum]